MSSSEKGSVFQINTQAVRKYQYFHQILYIILIGIWFFGVGLVLAFFHSFTLGPWLSRKQAAALKYWIEGGTLRVDEGVFFLKRKAIPLDRITDVILVQGPLMRWCGLWALHVQTAGTGQAVPEALLLGLADPEIKRDLIMAARDREVTRKK